MLCYSVPGARNVYILSHLIATLTLSDELFYPPKADEANEAQKD